MVPIARIEESTAGLLARHSRALSAAFILVLGGFGAAAFGVAPLLPDPADLPKRLLVSELTPEGMPSQLEALAEQEIELSRSDTTRKGDTIDSLLRRLGVADPGAASFLRTDASARRLLDGPAGKMVQVRASARGELVDLVARYAAPDDAQRRPRFSRLTVKHEQGRWVSTVEVAPLTTQPRLASGTVRSTLFAATDEARLPDSIASQLVDIFSADIDFHRELRKGDTFSVVYEAYAADSEPATWMPAAGRVLSAEFVNDGKAYQALWHADAAGRGSYFGFDGQSKRRTFLTSPLEFSRVTSGFSMRFHPLLQTWRQHLGVDYGAPTGTAVRAVGDGIVDFAGRQNGYGNVVQIRHDNHRSTLYAHLSRIDVHKGEAVSQGERIGAVGATGWATGPHLHFEFRVNGQYQDPQRLAKSSEPVTIDPSARMRFAEEARSARVQLDLAESLLGARPRLE